MKSFPLFLALRYLRPRGTAVSVITLISVLGVMLGVAVLVVVISVMSGFEKKIREVTLGFEPHVECHYAPSYSYGESLEANEEEPPKPLPLKSGWRDLLARMEAEPGVVKAAPIIRSYAFMEFDGAPVAAALRALRPEDFPADSELAAQIGDGKLELRGESIVLGLGISERLGAKVGDQVILYSSDNIRSVVDSVREISEDEGGDEADPDEAVEKLESVVLPYELTVRGVFQRSLQFDNEVVVPLFLGQELLGLDGEMTSLGLWTDQPDAAEENAAALAAFAPGEWYLVPWMHKPAVVQWFNTIRTQRSMMYLVLCMILLVAAFSIMNTIITVTVQKRREIGVITSLGGRVGQVMSIFLIQGAIVGFVGAGLGLGAGLLVLRFRNVAQTKLYDWFGIEIFPTEVYQVPEIPAELRPADLAIITIGAFVVSTLAALLPAWRAARVDPARALRNQ